MYFWLLSCIYLFSIFCFRSLCDILKCSQLSFLCYSISLAWKYCDKYWNYGFDEEICLKEIIFIIIWKCYLILFNTYLQKLWTVELEATKCWSRLFANACFLHQMLYLCLNFIVNSLCSSCLLLAGMHIWHWSSGGNQLFSFWCQEQVQGEILPFLVFIW